MFFESALEKIARIITRQYGISVVYRGTGASTDGKTIFLPSLPREVPKDLIADLHGFVDHECGHCKFTNFKVFSEAKTSLHRDMLNNVEDERVEKEMVKEFPGTSLHLDPLNEKMFGQVVANWDKVSELGKLVVNVRQIMAGKEIIPDPLTLICFTKKVIDLCKKMASAASTKELYVLTWQVIEEMKDKLKKEKEKRQEKKDKKEKSEKKEKDDAGEEDKENESDENEEDEGSESKEKSSKKDKEKSPKKEDKEEGSEEDKEEGSESKEKSPKKDKKEKSAKKDKEEKETESSESKEDEGSEEDKEKEEGSEEVNENECPLPEDLDDDYNDDISKSVEEMINKDLESTAKELGKEVEADFRGNKKFKNAPHIPYTTQHDKTHILVKGNGTDYGKILRPVKYLVNKLKTELEMILQTRTNAKWLVDQESGRLMSSRLSKVITSPSYKTPFKTLTKTETRDIAVEIVVDLSGSMVGQQVELAKSTVAAMGEALNLLQIDFEIVGFNTGGSTADHVSSSELEIYNRFCSLNTYIFKRFDDQQLYGIANMKAGGANCDGESIRIFANRLSQSRRKRKIMLVLSDGEPACYCREQEILNYDLKKAVTEVERFGIECVGFGIMTDAVKHFYKDHVIINKIEDLPTECMKKLREILKI